MDPATYEHDGVKFNLVLRRAEPRACLVDFKCRHRWPFEFGKDRERARGVIGRE